MKSVLKKIAVFVLIGTLAVSGVACGGTGDAGENVVQLNYWNSGYGDEWLNTLIEEFNETNGTYTVQLESSTNQSTVTSTLSAGERNPYDLYITALPSWSGTEPDMVDLSDVLDYTYGDESQPIRQKMNEYFLQMRTHNGEVRSLSLGEGAVGLFYNYDLFEEYNLWDMFPYTTDQLEDLAWHIQGRTDMTTDRGEKITAFAHFKDDNNGYWKYVYEPWAVQLMGVKEYTENFIMLKNSDGTDQYNVYYGYTPSGEENKENDARYKVLQAMEAMITNSTVHPRSNEDNFTTMQTAFINGQSVMMANGSWLKNEMSISNDVDIRLMKTPVISDIVETLDDNTMSDDVLAEIVKAIDENKPFEQVKEQIGRETFTSDDYARIKEARGIMYGSDANGGVHVFIPRYSTAIDGAKEFLKYMYSDAGAKVWMETQHGPFAVSLDDPSLVDTSGWDDWDKSISDVLADATFTMQGTLNQSKVFSENGRDMYANTNIITRLTVNNPDDRMDADKLWKAMRKIIDDNWELWI